MNPASDVLKNFNGYINNRGFQGNIAELTLPKLNVKIADFQAGGLEAPLGIDMGIEKMEATIVISAYDAGALTTWGNGDSVRTPFVAKGALQSRNGVVKAVHAVMMGETRGLEAGTWKPGEQSNLTFTIEVTYYRLTIDGRNLIEIDVPNMVRKINGVDRLAAIRAAIR